MKQKSWPLRQRWIWPLVCVACLGTVLALSRPVAGVGSGDLFPAPPEAETEWRANIEWRNSLYGDRLLRRTLFFLYAEAGEYILVGSSAVDVPDEPDFGDIQIFFEPALVTADHGREELPADPLFSCLEQRAETEIPDQGRIASRAEELAGPGTVDGTSTEGYVPCYFEAPETGIYQVAFFGPYGRDTNINLPPTGELDPPPIDFTAEQGSSITAWDVTVRDALNDPATVETGRLFVYYAAMWTGGNGRPVAADIYVVTGDGFIYDVELQGDPNGFVIYSNQFGFRDADGSPLYRNVMAVPTLPTQEQNQLYELQGDTEVDGAEYPLFIQYPDPEVLEALGIPLTPRPPMINDLSFEGSMGGITTRLGEGGTFSFTVESAGSYLLTISRDGENFDPEAAQNRSLRGFIDHAGPVTVEWDGRDNTGELFPVGESYVARARVQGGEMHLPFLDVENNLSGAPVLFLTNPPDGICPDLEGGCYGGFYDDRGYLTSDGVLVGSEYNGYLCEGGTGNPPAILFSDPIRGFDTRTGQRGYGFADGGNPEAICLPTSGFGDKKGLDLWTYYPSNEIRTPLRIVEPTAITLLQFGALRDGDQTTISWTTGVEIDTWGFRLYRSADGLRATAELITPQLILAEGSSTGGATYSFIDTTAAAGTVYSYWLQEEEITGAINEYGPITTRASLANGDQRVWLPLVVR